MSSIDAKLDKISDKIDALDKRQDSMDITLVKNTQILDEHQRRSAALEALVDKNETSYQEELKPIKAHIETMKTGFKAIAWFCGVLAAVVGLLLTLKQLGFF